MAKKPGRDSWINEMNRDYRQEGYIAYIDSKTREEAYKEHSGKTGMSGRGGEAIRREDFENIL